MNKNIRLKRRQPQLKQRQNAEIHKKQQAAHQDYAHDPLVALKEYHHMADTPKADQPNVVLALQRSIGNAATMDMVQRWGWIEQHKSALHIPQPAPIQRATGDAGGAGAGTLADPVPNVLGKLRASEHLLDRNTAQIIDMGRVKWWYIDQCPPDPATPFKPGDQFRTVIHPGNGGRMRVSVTADGFQSDGIFIKRSATEDRIRTIIIHEINHAVRGDHESDDDAASFGRYTDEFQAYWVAEFADIADLDSRAQRIKNHILTAGSYQPLQNRYNTDAAFKAQIDAHTRPDGNILNSVRWQIAEEALKKNDKPRYFSAIKVMDSEREVVRGNTDFMTLTRSKLNNSELLTAYLILYQYPDGAVLASEAMQRKDKKAVLAALSLMNSEERKATRAYKSFLDHLRVAMNDYDSLLKAYLILYDFTPLALGVVDAMTGPGTDEETIYKLLLDMTSEDRKRLREYESFMWRLRDDLSKSEMEVVERILKL